MADYIDDPSNIDDVWTTNGDSLHPYGAFDWFSTMVLDTLSPAIQLARGPMSSQPPQQNHLRTINGRPNAIELSGVDTALLEHGGPRSTQDNSFYFRLPPRVEGFVGFLPNNGWWNGGNQTYSALTGFGIKQVATIGPNSLSITVNGTVIARFGGEIVGNFGAIFATSATDRAAKGYEFHSPRTVRPAARFVALTDATSEIISLRRDGTSNASTEGNPVWSWFIDGRLEYWGASGTTHKTTFTYAAPAAAVTIHTPVNAVAGTGANARVIGVIPSYADATAGQAAVDVGDIYYDEATGKVKCRMS